MKWPWKKKKLSFDEAERFNWELDTNAELRPEIPSVVVTQEQVMSAQNITVKNHSDVAEDAYTDGATVLL